MNNLFINQNNISLIWDILSENQHFVKFSDNKRDIVFNALQEDMIIFYDKYNTPNLGILELNKKFLSQITNALKLKEKEQSTKIVSFEESLEIKKKELQGYLKMDIPPPIDFSDKLIEEKINNIDELMQHVINERKFESPPIFNDRLAEYKVKTETNVESKPNITINKPIMLDFTPNSSNQDIKSLDKRLVMLEQQMNMIVKEMKEISALLHIAPLRLESNHDNNDEDGNNEDDDNDCSYSSEKTAAVN